MRIDTRAILIPFLIIAFIGPAAGRQTLTLEQATAKALAENGEIRGAAKDVDAAHNGIRQARKLPNPELELTTEDFGSTSTGFTVTQPLGFGVKRKARIGLAKVDSIRARIEADSKKAAIASETRRRFFRALGSRAEMELIDSLMALAENSKAAIEKHVEAGFGSRTEVLRSENDISLLRLERNRVNREYESAVVSLMALWGEHRPAVLPEITGDLDSDVLGPKFSFTGEMIANSPVVRMSMAEVDAFTAETKAAKAEGFPEMSLSAGFTNDVEEDNRIVELGLSAGLPLFDRNTNASKAAGLRVEGARERVEAIRSETRGLYEQHMNAIAGFRETAQELRSSIIPKASQVYAELQRLYNAGKSSYLDLAAAQRELMDARRELVNTSVEAQSALADILELTGQYTAAEKTP